jgi:hypothetical protein
VHFQDLRHHLQAVSNHQQKHIEGLQLDVHAMIVASHAAHPLQVKWRQLYLFSVSGSAYIIMLRMMQYDIDNQTQAPYIRSAHRAQADWLWTPHSM